MRKVLVRERGFIKGPQRGRLKQEHGIDTVLPLRSDMDLLEDVRGLRKRLTSGEEYQPRKREPLPDVTAASHGQTAPGTAKKRERKRQKTVARKQAEREAASPPEPSQVRQRTRRGRFAQLRSWGECPVPLTGVLSRDVFAEGHETSWLLGTTHATWSARRVRALYGLRTDLEERPRQIKCFWDLTRFHWTAGSLVVSQTVFVCLTYRLLPLPLLRQGHAALNRRLAQTTRRLLPDADRGVVYREQSFAFFTLLEHRELTLSLEGKARRRALSKARSLLHSEPPASDMPDRP